MKKLCENTSNTYSAFGEDGIIEKIFEIIGISSRVCIEVGAWDGLHLSNTANLWKKGWKAILIEADETRFKALLENTAGYDCDCIAAFVRPSGEDTIENILRNRQLLRDVDFLSIDIDGDDYFVFESLRQLKPRVVACEYNPTIPFHIELVPTQGNCFGCSPLSLVKLAQSKGYRLVALTETNAFFVLKDDFDKFSEYETSLDSLAINKNLTYLMSGYAGDYLASREPTYGCNGPSNQRFIVGECFHFPVTPVQKLLSNMNPVLKRAAGRIITKIMKIRAFASKEDQRSFGHVRPGPH